MITTSRVFLSYYLKAVGFNRLGFLLEEVVKLDSYSVQFGLRYITAVLEPCVHQHVVRAVVCLKSLTMTCPVVVYMMLEIPAFTESDPSFLSLCISRSAFPCFLVCFYLRTCHPLFGTCTSFFTAPSWCAVVQSARKSPRNSCSFSPSC